MASAASRGGLAGLNFFIAALQTGFGVFLVVYLTQQGWNEAEVGTALSLGVGVSLLAQLPGGMLVDAVHAKRVLMAGALVLLAVSALIFVVSPRRFPVWGAQALHAADSAVLTPAIAAVTLTVCGHALFSAQLGTNSRWASLGNAGTAVLLGAAATYLAPRSVFFLTALMALPALAALAVVGSGRDRPIEVDHPALLHPRRRRKKRMRPWQVFFELHLHVFAVSVALFEFADAGLLPLALEQVTRHGGKLVGFVTTGTIVFPQLLAAAISPTFGRMAERIGRRPLLMAGFAVLPVRGVLFALLPSELPVILIQSLDGVSAAVMGIMIPLIAADLTRRNGYLNLAIGSLGLAAGLGALPSTLISGWIANRFGATPAFLLLAAAGAAGFVLIATSMTETKRHARRRKPRKISTKIAR